MPRPAKRPRMPPPGPDAGAPAPAGPPQRPPRRRGSRLLREAIAMAIVLALVVGLLYGLTGQGMPFGGGSPVVVVTTGSMMHCEGHFPDRPGPPLGKDCEPTRWGRIGTIDPGDLVFVVRVDEPSDVATEAEGDGHTYGKGGDVIVYRPRGQAGATPVIHRALFYLEIRADGRFAVPALGIGPVASLDHERIRAYTGCDITATAKAWAHAYSGRPDRGSGFVTRGDNNDSSDACGTQLGIARMDWVLGKARGEVPWVGLVNLLWGQWTGPPVTGCPGGCFNDAGGDSKVMFFVVVVALVALPWLLELGRGLWRRRRARRDETGRL